MSKPSVTDDFTADMSDELLHQIDVGRSRNDAEKTDADWFWLMGWVLGKAMRPGISLEKKRHRLRAAATILWQWDSRLAESAQQA